MWVVGVGQRIKCGLDALGLSSITPGLGFTATFTLLGGERVLPGCEAIQGLIQHENLNSARAFLGVSNLLVRETCCLQLFHRVVTCDRLRDILKNLSMLPTTIASFGAGPGEMGMMA